MSPGDRPLYRVERAGLALVAAGLVVFGGVVVLRSAYLTTRMTDFGVYARAGHAVRAGLDLYAKNTCDDRGWHYVYPPPFAVVMVPLADPFRPDPRPWCLPFGVSVAVWYALSVGLLAATAHQLATAALPDAVRGSRRWWYARTVPVYVCLGGAGFTLARGQVNILAVWLVAMMFVAAVRRKPVRAGVWLAAAVALKVIPALLVLFPVVRGDRRSGVGFTIGLVVLLLGVPAAVWGPAEAVRQNARFVNLVLAPGVLGIEQADAGLAKELTGATATDSQSFQAAVHNLIHRDLKMDDRPTTADPAARLLHWLLGGLMAAVTVAAGVTRATRSAADQLVLLGCFCVTMLHLTPVSHMHYYFYAYPLVVGLWAQGTATRPGRAGPGRATTLVLVGWGGLIVLALTDGVPGGPLREYGGAVAATVGLWGFGLVRLGVRNQRPAAG